MPSAWQKKKVADMTPEEKREYNKALEKQKETRNRKKQNPSSFPLSQTANPLSSANSEPTVLNAVNAEPADAAPRQLGRNEKKYQKLLDDYLGPATGIIILVLCLFVYRFDMESSEKIADYLAMNKDEQDLIIPPLASWMDKQSWSPETRDRILQSGDLVGLTLGLASYGSRVLGTLRELRGQVHEQSGVNAAQQAAQSGAGGAVASSNGHNVQWGSELASLAQYAA